MGYVIRLVDQDFRINAQDKPYALADIPGPIDDEGSVRPWMHHASDNWKYLRDALADWRFEPQEDDEYNIVGLEFTGQKIGDESEMFEAIAEYVEDGSYLEFLGEDGQKYRYEFHGDRLVKRDDAYVRREDDLTAMEQALEMLRENNPRKAEEILEEIVESEK